jgi:hypothetical protein
MVLCGLYGDAKFVWSIVMICSNALPRYVSSGIKVVW